MKRLASGFGVVTVATLVLAGTALAGTGGSTGIAPLQPTIGTAAAFDKSPPLRDMRMIAPGAQQQSWVRPMATDRSLVGRVANTKHQPDGALQNGEAPNAMPAPLFTFEGPSNADNLNIFGFRVNPPDPVGDVGSHNYVAMVNLTFAIYSKTGTLQYGPADTGTLWQGFSVPDCTEPNGDPIVVYDEISNRWILSQFTSRWSRILELRRGLDDPRSARFVLPLCVLDRAFFPDYPKYGVMSDALYITTREFGPTVEYQIGVYAIDRHDLIGGPSDPDRRFVLPRRRCRSPLPPGRRDPAGRPRWEEEAARAQSGVLRGDDGRRLRLRGAVRRDQLVRGRRRLQPPGDLDVRPHRVDTDGAV